LAVVTQIGDFTEMGKIKEDIENAKNSKDKKSELKKKLD